MFNKQGFSIKALKAGHIQKATSFISLNFTDSVDVNLFYDGVGYTVEVLTTNAKNGVVNRLEWSTFEGATLARVVWTKYIRKYFSTELSKYNKQTRTSVGLEFTGKENPVYVLRWNGDFVTEFNNELSAKVMAGKLASLDLVDLYKAKSILNNNRVQQ